MSLFLKHVAVFFLVAGATYSLLAFTPDDIVASPTSATPAIPAGFTYSV